MLSLSPSLSQLAHPLPCCVLGRVVRSSLKHQLRSRTGGVGTSAAGEKAVDAAAVDTPRNHDAPDTEPSAEAPAFIQPAPVSTARVKGETAVRGRPTDGP